MMTRPSTSQGPARRLGQLALLGLGLLLLAPVGCRKGSESRSATIGKVPAPAPAKASAADASQVELGPETTLNPAHKKPDTPIFVGGCREACRVGAG